jgi:hypothetical protein
VWWRDDWEADHLEVFKPDALAAHTEFFRVRRTFIAANSAYLAVALQRVYLQV